MLSAIGSYILVSLLGKKHQADLDKLLHRGKYAVKTDQVKNIKPTHRIIKALGITDEFTKWDKFIYFATLCFSMIWVVIFWIGTALGLIFETPDKLWAAFWNIKIWINLVLSFVVMTWLTLGGMRDMIDMFRLLKVAGRDTDDDGRVEHNKNSRKL